MIKTLIWLGSALTALGFVVLLVFVVPEVGWAHSASATHGPAAGPSVLAAFVAGFGLAAGLSLIGIGFGHWKHPRPSGGENGSPEV